MVSSQGNRGILLSLWVIEDKFQNDLKFLRNLADVLYILLSQVYPRMREREDCNGPNFINTFCRLIFKVSYYFFGFRI